jgi:hypothetical protein
MTLRMAFTQVPAWELALVIAMLVLFSVLTIWLAGKAFRSACCSTPSASNSASFSRREARCE